MIAEIREKNTEKAILFLVKNLIKFLIILIIVFSLSLFLFTNTVYSYPEKIIYTPTALTLRSSFFSLYMYHYQNGGVFLAPMVYISKNFGFGFSADVERAVGSEDAQFNIPTIRVKVKITDTLFSSPFYIAIGYDALYPNYFGKVDNDKNELDRLETGPYFVITKPFLFSENGFPHLLNIGVRMPIQPFYKKELSEAFIGYSLPIGDIFFLSTEVSRIILSNQNENTPPIFSIGGFFQFFHKLNVGFIVAMQKDFPPDRMVYIKYIDQI